MFSYNKTIEICDLGDDAKLADLMEFRESCDVALGECVYVTGFKSGYMRDTEGDIYGVSYEIECDDVGTDAVHSILSPW